MSGWTTDQMAWMQKAARGCVTVQNVCAAPEKNFAPRYLPRLAGANVRPTGMPDDGYVTPMDARAGGQAYRKACRDELSRAAA